MMDVKTGEILALAGRERTFDGQFQPCYNFAYQQEPGSTMMIPAVMAMLETGKTKLTDEFDTQEGVWNIEDGIIMRDHNWHRGGYGMITLEKALEVSSNIAVSKAVHKTFKGNEQRYFELLDKMSFGKPDSIEGIANLRKMFFTSPKDSIWAKDQLLYSSIGYERRLTPIQTLTFYNAIANDGKMVKPTLFKGKTEVINKQIASKKTINEIQHSLYNIVYQGLGKKAGSELTSVAGKTGAASVGTLGDGEITEYHVSFCGYFPANAPRYSIIVSMNKYGLPATGGLMAGTVFHNIVEWMVKHNMIR
ncbi:MAG: penicillin-binding protein [Prevotella sp.]|nr:penicillin-binding protein [Prevotella sp.]